MKKRLAVLFIMSSLLVGCGQTSIPNTTVTKGNSDDNEIKSYIDIELGKDYTDLKADITVLTPRTDLVQDTDAPNEFPDYLREFNKMYPNINVLYESVTDYDFDVNNRLGSGGWGDICSIPPGVDNSKLADYFEPYFTLEEIGDKYNFIWYKAYEDIVYGLPSTGNIQGLVYNKQVFKDAGIEELPKTPDEFLKDLQLIKDNTSAIPLYTNYAAGWTLLNWDYHVVSSAVGREDFKNDIIVTTKRPFVPYDDGTGPYAVYELLYNAVEQGLIEDDPHNSSWELCKGRINNGEIGCMVLGSWSVSQMKGAGDNADDIGYMPFPITIDGKQYTLSGSDYCYGINKKSSETNKLASMIYLKYMTDVSKYAYNNSCTPIVKGEEYPEEFKAFDEVELIPDYPMSSTFESVSNASMKLLYDSGHVAEVIDGALEGRPFDEIMEEWNDSWENAVIAESKKMNNEDMQFSE